MAGDHKCPVCSSTFTRPQHVARHMRSHTGDRPYKCVHCGDQFARSDLLSRHVNKCHASEKPPTTTQPARRKGHAQPGSSSAGGVRGPAPPLIPPPGSRKICDPCAHSRTPAQCDSGLPCGKCLQRNTKCTYLKPSDTRRTVSRTHDLFPDPAAPLTVPSMARPADPFPSQPAFNFTVPLYPQSAAPYAPPFDPSASVESTASDPTLLLSHGFSRQPAPPVYPQQQYTDSRKQSLDAFLNQSYPTDLPAFLYSNTTSAPADVPAVPAHQQYGFDPAHPYYDASTQRDPVPSDFTYQQPYSQDAFPAQQQQQYTAQPEAVFSSAFGLMSLDDPAVAAEMSKTGAYFAPGALRPTGAKLPEAATPGKDANIAELRDFWKAFMRDHTPGENVPKTPINNNNGELARPGARRSLSKMASLPDIKTPPVDGGGPHYSTVEEARHQYQNEDLRSYEQAVLARRAPVNLTLAPPRRRHHPQPHTHSSPDTGSTGTSTDGEGAGGGAGGGVPARPTFKRLASQTLGPFESKSVKVSHPGVGVGVGVEAIAAYERGGGGGYEDVERVRGGGYDVNGGGSGSGIVNGNGNGHGAAYDTRAHKHVRSPSGEYSPAMHQHQPRDRRLSAPAGPVFDHEREV